MKLLIKILHANQQICEEALSLAFAMVAFEHEVQLWLGEDCQMQLLDTQGKLHKMLCSLHLYDMPAAWFESEQNGLAEVSKSLMSQLIPLPKQINLADFDTVLTF